MFETGMLFERKVSHIARRLILVAVLLSALGLCACSTQAGQATEQSDDTAYSIAFTTWSGERNYELSLEEGESLQVEITHGGGDIRLSIHAMDGSAVYRGKGLPTSSFTVNVPAPGRYVVTILGKDADGQVHVQKEALEESDGRE